MIGHVVTRYKKPAGNMVSNIRLDYSVGTVYDMSTSLTIDFNIVITYQPISIV